MRRGKTTGGSGRQSAVDRWRQKHEEQEAKRKTGGRVYSAPNDVEMFKQESRGTRLLKLIPYPVKDKEHPDEIDGVAFRRPYNVHKNIGPEETDVVCLSTFNRKCAVCTERDRMRARGDKDLASALNYSRRAMYLVADCEERKPSLFLADQPMSMGKAPGFGRLLEEEVMSLDAASPAPWEEDGPWLEVRFGQDEWNGKPFYPANKINLVQPEKKIDWAALEAAAPCLDDCLTVLTYEQMEAVLHGIDIPEAEGEEAGGEPEETNEPPRRSRRRAEPEPEPEPPAEEEGEEEVTEDDVRSALDEVDDMDHDEIVDCADMFEIDLDQKDVRASKKGDKGARRSLKKYLKQILNEMLEGEPPADEEVPPPETPKPSSRRAARQAAKKNSGECPHGHEFGTDCDEFPDDCNKCDVWDACVEAQEASK